MKLLALYYIGRKALVETFCHGLHGLALKKKQLFGNFFNVLLAHIVSAELVIFSSPFEKTKQVLFLVCTINGVACTYHTIVKTA